MGNLAISIFGNPPILLQHLHHFRTKVLVLDNFNAQNDMISRCLDTESMCRKSIANVVLYQIRSSKALALARVNCQKVAALQDH